MSNVTDFTGKRDVPPPPKRHGHWLPAAAMVLFVVLFLASTLALIFYERSQPSDVVTAYVPQTVVVTKEVIRVVTVQPEPTLPPVEVTRVVQVEVTRVVRETVTVNTFYTPTPPASGRG